MQPAQQLSIRVIAPPSSYMYEMMKLQKRMMAASSTSKIQTQIRFLIIGDSAEAVNELVSEARPAFEGVNPQGAGKESMATCLLMVNFRRLLPVA